MSDALLKLMLLALIAMQGNDTTATRQGTVVRAGTSEGLSKALVELYPAGVGALSDYASSAAILSFIKTKEKTFTATTDSKGAFFISGIPEGRYRLSATRNGFSRSEYGQRGGNDQGAVINIGAGARLANLAVAMRPAPTINGVVHDERDRPVAYAAVLAFAVEYQPGGARKYRLIQSVNSDDRGQYRLFWLSPGDYIVAVENARVELSVGETSSRIVRTDARGRYEITGIQPGQYRLKVTADGFAAAEFGQPATNMPRVTLSVAAGSTADPISFQLVRAATITGRVFDIDSEPLAGAIVLVSKAVYGPNGRRVAPAGFTRTDDRGEYRLYWLTPDEYYVLQQLA